MVAAITGGLVAWIQFDHASARIGPARGTRDPDDSSANQRSLGSFSNIDRERHTLRCDEHSRPTAILVCVKAGYMRSGT